MRWHVELAVLVFGVLIAKAADIAAGAAPSSEEFRDKYSRAAKALEAQVENIQCVVNVKAQWEKCPLEKQLFVKGPSKLEIRTYLCQPKERIAHRKAICVTAEEAFTLFQSAESEPYRIDTYSRDDDAKAKDRMIRLNVDMYAFSAFSILGYSIPKLMEDPSFRIVRVENLRTDGKHQDKELVVIDFALESTEFPLLSGTATFSPSMTWALTEFRDVRVRWPNGTVAVYTGNQTYNATDQSHQEVGPPRRIVVTEYNPSYQDEPANMFEVEIDRVSTGTVADSQFRLPSFGIAEIATAPESGSRATNRIIWLFVANAALLTIVLLIVWFRRRALRRSQKRNDSI